MNKSFNIKVGSYERNVVKSHVSSTPPFSICTIMFDMPTPPCEIAPNMKIIKDALPTMLTIFLTTCYPTKAAMVATPTKYRAAKQVQNHTMPCI